MCKCHYLIKLYYLLFLCGTSLSKRIYTLVELVIGNMKQNVPVASRHFTSNSLKQTNYPAMGDFSREKKKSVPNPED